MLLLGGTGTARADTPRVTIQVWLTPDLAGASSFADAVSTPGNPQFHHYLSPDAYAARFGATAAHATTVANWLTARGLTDIHASSGRDYVSATGTESAAQSVVHAPASLAGTVLGVTGMSGAPADKPAAAPQCSRYWAQRTQKFSPAYQGLTEGALPVCGYSAAQIRAAYGANRADTGAGQIVAMTEDEAPTAMFRTLTDYATTNHLPAPKSAQYREQHVDTGGTCGSSTRDDADPTASDEQEMDSEAVYAMAPAATQLMVVASGCDEDQALLDADLSVLTGDGHHPSATIVSNSWQIPEGEVPAQTVHAMDLRAAAEGVGMYVASGDTPGLTATDDDPYVTAVGGTTLGLGARDNRLFETGWSTDNGFLADGAWTDQGISVGAGGGTSSTYAQPGYQKGVVPASMSRAGANRAVPDIAADGDPDTGMLTGYRQTADGPYQTVVNAGTSLACPLIAGLVADAQQGQRAPFGFVNPLLYRLSGTPALHDALPLTASAPQPDRDAYLPASGTDSPEVDVFDAQDPAYTQQVTAPGYDTMTGLGTPNGAAFIAGLRHAAR
jgi:subtilase family serine protease